MLVQDVTLSPVPIQPMWQLPKARPYGHQSRFRTEKYLLPAKHVIKRVNI